MSISAISKRIWNLCHVLRDDGVVYHKYLAELTYLLFLKVAEETRREDLLPEGSRWKDLVATSKGGMLGQYRKMLTTLGEDAPDLVVREIFRFPTTVFSHEENLRKVVDGINELDWHEAKADGLGNIYEGLLQRSAAEARTGAGQYFTPRPLVDCLVSVLAPKPGDVIQDPAAGTGGFLISANEYILDAFGSEAYSAKPPSYQAVEIENDTYRLCLMNLFLHEMKGKAIHGDALTSDVVGLEAPDVIIANPPFGTSAGGARRKRSDLPYATSNKQLLFLQHIYRALKPGGRAAVVVPDNVLYEDGVGRRVRSDLMDSCNLHTILRLPTGIFYATDVKTSVLFFDALRDGEEATSKIWVYDLRSNIRRFNKSTLLDANFFSGFKNSFGDVSKGFLERSESDPDGRFKLFSRDEVAKRSDSLDLWWLSGDAEDAGFDERQPDEIAQAIIHALRGAISELEELVSNEAESDGE
jgi:type I restriction enzyme M protein